MECPYCKQEMDLGFIQSRDGVYWVKTKRASSNALPPRRSKDVVPLNVGKVSYFNGGYAEAWLCRACKKVVIDYAPKKTGEDEE